jgi:hypothetical protein
MPQLDSTILQVQVNSLIVFFFGYFVFLKYLLPLLSFFLKSKSKLIILNLSWIKNNSSELLIYKRSFLISVLKFSSFLNVINFFNKDRFIFCNLYNLDHLIVRNFYL